MDFSKLLSGGDLRSIGNAEIAVSAVRKDNGLFSALFECVYSQDPVVRMRAADAVEKITRKYPELLATYKAELLEKVSKIKQQEVQWHLAQIIPRLRLVDSEVGQAMGILSKNLKNTQSNIVKVFSIQAIYDISRGNKEFLKFADEILQDYKNDKSAAVRSRVKKLLSQ